MTPKTKLSQYLADSDSDSDSDTDSETDSDTDSDSDSEWRSYTEFAPEGPRDFNYKQSSDNYGADTEREARGGIIGYTTVYYLTHHPHFDPSIHAVTLIEATKLANRASGKAGGLLAAWAYPNNLTKLSFDLHDQLARDYDGAEL
ncbi:hypothetical protein F5882DRAFT_490751 [Hyaloscypha sp. PMI_1271]|nr:hypothetical protein F5882DRAFT_490751 [Hyaloscypha sp. PMI_1271]